MMKSLFRLVLLLFMVVVLPMSSCSSSSKASRTIRKKKMTMINTTQLGKNKYFFSPKYQRKLGRKRKGKR